MKSRMSSGPHLLQCVLQPVSPKLRKHRVRELIAHGGRHVTLALYGRGWFVLMVRTRWESLPWSSSLNAFAVLYEVRS